MQAKLRKCNAPKKFEPVELVLTLETQGELTALRTIVECNNALGYKRFDATCIDDSARIGIRAFVVAVSVALAQQEEKA